MYTLINKTHKNTYFLILPSINRPYFLRLSLTFKLIS